MEKEPTFAHTCSDSEACDASFFIVQNSLIGSVTTDAQESGSVTSPFVYGIGRYSFREEDGK